ncbi:MAG: hypothetical protein Q8L77_00460 [Nitrospirota bacterium]|nr:hypothetical protein [Nitrospirota bacterium]
MRHNAMTVWGVSVLVLAATPVWAQTAPPVQNGQVEMVGALPRTASGTVDIEALKQTIQTQFARPGVQEVQFRNVSLTEAEQRALFLNGDPNKNLLRQVSAVVPSSNGAERNVTFRSHDFRARIGREEGQLRARIEGIDQSQLTEPERQNLRAQFDRFRLEGGNDRGGNRAEGRGGHGGDDNSGPGSGNSGSGSVNSGSGRGGRDDVRMAQAGDVRQEDRQADRHEDRRANRGGEVRGLDRADQVAGEQGREGRDNARSVQMDRSNRPERVERSQRPERPERPQRPERPEKPERAGRN